MPETALSITYNIYRNLGFCERWHIIFIYITRINTTKTNKRTKETNKTYHGNNSSSEGQEKKIGLSDITPSTNTIYEKKIKQGPTKPIMRTVEVQKTKSRTPEPQSKTVHYGIKLTKNPETNNKNIIQKEGPSAKTVSRNRSLRWSTTRSNSKNTDKQKE